MILPLPLKWQRRTIAVKLRKVGDPSTYYAEVASGIVAGPFAVYPGDPFSIESKRTFTLYHLPAQVPMFTLPTQFLCKQAAGELATLDMNWASGVPDEVTGADFGRAAEVHRRWQARAEELR